MFSSFTKVRANSPVSFFVAVGVLTLLAVTPLLLIRTPVFIKVDHYFIQLENSNLSASSQKNNNFYSGNCLKNKTKSLIKIFREKWPRMELMMPLAPTNASLREFTTLFLPSYELFWPIEHSNASLLIMLDEEEVTAAHQGNETALNLVERIKLAPCQYSHRPRLPFRFALDYLPMNDVAFLYMSGHSRQQWIEFWADNFTLPGTEFIGFVDTDTFFDTRVTKSDLFDDRNRPIVRPLFGKASNDWWAKVPKGSYNAIGLKEPFSCMTFFPVIIRVSHLRLIRRHIIRHLKVRTFDDGFLRIISEGAYFSQFDIMCTYLWWYKRDEYHWVIAERDPAWWGPIPDGQVESMDEAGIEPKHLARHGPRLAVHWSYEAFSFNSEAIPTIFRTGLCYSLPESHNLWHACSKWMKDYNFSRRNSFNQYEWTFEWYNLAHNTTHALIAHRQRLDRNDNIETDWDEDLLGKYLIL